MSPLSSTLPLIEFSRLSDEILHAKERIIARRDHFASFNSPAFNFLPYNSAAASVPNRSKISNLVADGM
jgi:hypothetical protein